MARHSPAPRPGAFVTAWTALALAVVTFFAYQASAADDRAASGAAPAESPSPSDGDESGDGDGGAGEAEADETALPADSGEGKRVVYALERQRIWLVDVAEDGTGEAVADTYEVHPSSVLPEPGEYAVTSRTPQITGSDGVPVQNVVVFHVDAEGIVFGFSTALDGSVPDPDGAERTGGVRQSSEDGDAMWLFTDVGLPVVVVP